MRAHAPCIPIPLCVGTWQQPLSFSIGKCVVTRQRWSGHRKLRIESPDRAICSSETIHDPMAAPPPLPAPPPPEPSGGVVAPVAVVAPHFCAPYVVQLLVKERFSLREGDFTITDTNGAVVITVKGALISIHNRRLLLDAAGNPLLSLREKVNELN